MEEFLSTPFYYFHASMVSLYDALLGKSDSDHAKCGGVSFDSVIVFVDLIGIPYSPPGFPI